jgi:hypothetical protein
MSKEVIQIPRNIGAKKHWLWDKLKRPDLIILDDMEENMEEKTVDRSSQMDYTTSTPAGTFWGAGLMATLPKCHQVKIDKVANGFIVEIGCKKFVAEKWDILAKKLAEYWDDPIAAEKKYAK